MQEKQEMANIGIFSVGPVRKILPKCLWTVYVEKMHFYYSANDIENKEIKNSILLKSVRTAMFTILRNIVVPNTLKEIIYEDLLKKAK